MYEKIRDFTREETLKKKASRRLKDDKKYTALHWAAYRGRSQCCKVLLETDWGLIKEKDKKGKYALDVAHDQGHFDVFAFLLEKFSKKSVRIPEDLTERFHSYAHQMLSKGRESLLEAVVRGNWWEAAFGLGGKKMHGEAPCLLFRETIKEFPELAYSIMTKCYNRRDFRLLEDNFWMEEQELTRSSSHKRDTKGSVRGARETQGRGSQGGSFKNPEKDAQQVVYVGMNWKRQHPLYTMGSGVSNLPLLHHPLTKAWLAYKWRTYARYIFALLMILRAFSISSLVAFLCCIRRDISQHDNMDTMSSEQITVPVHVLVVMGISAMLHLLEYINRKCHFKDNSLLQLIQLLLPLSTVATLVIFLAWDAIWAYFLGILALVLIGMEFIFWIDHLPCLNILASITREFMCKYLKGLLCAVCMISLFAFIFFLMFIKEKAFETMPYAFLSIAFWQMGDFNQEIFFKDIRFPGLSHLLFIVYLCTFGAFIVTLIHAPSITREASLLNKKMKMINLIFEIDICFPRIKNWYKNGILYYEEQSKEDLMQKCHCEFWKKWMEEEKEEPVDEIAFKFGDKCKRCGRICTCPNKAESRLAELVAEKQQELMQEIKSLQVQMNFLQQKMNN